MNPSNSRLNVLSNRNFVHDIRDAPREESSFVESPLLVLDEPRRDINYDEIGEKIIAAIRTVFDPELPVNLFDLGLIYGIELKSLDSGLTAHIKMTLTSPGCPVAGTLPGEVQRKVQAAAGLVSTTVELVWQPAWSKSRMSEAALLECGLL